MRSHYAAKSIKYARPYYRRSGSTGWAVPTSTRQRRWHRRTNSNVSGYAYWIFVIGRTCWVSMAYLTLGLVQSIAGPTLPDLRDRLDTTMEDLSLALGFRSFGALAGSMLCGMLADRYPRKGDIFMGAAVICAGIPEIIKPLTNSLVVVGVVSFFGGMGQGGLEAVGHALIMWMWAENSGPPFHAIHMGYPIGSTLAPLIAMPFLGVKVNQEDEVYVANTSTSGPYWPVDGGLNNLTMPTRTPQSIIEGSRIEIPYGIIGGVTCLVGLVFWITFLIGPPKGFVLHRVKKSSMLQVFSPATCRSMGTTRYTCVLLILVCTFYVFVSAKDGTICTYTFSFTVESDIGFTKHEAAIFDTVFRSMEIVGRVLGIVASHLFRIQPMLLTLVVSNTVFTTCLVFLGTKNRLYLWVFACLFRLSAAPVWPSGITWISEYLRFSSMVVALIQIVLGSTGYFFNWLAGYLYTEFEPSAFIFYGMVCGFVVLIVLVAMQVVASCCSSKENPDDVTEEVVESPSNVYRSVKTNADSTQI